MESKRGRMLVVMLGVLTIGAVGIQRTYSYFTEKSSVDNVFTVGNLEISLNETEWEVEKDDGTSLYPGYTAYKNPTVRNVKRDQRTTQPCYFQMKIRVRDEENQPVTDPERLRMIRETIRYDASYNGSSIKKGTAQGLKEGRVPGYTMEEIEKYPMVNPEFDELKGNQGEWVFGYKGGKEATLEGDEEKVLFTNIVIPTEWEKEDMELLGAFHLAVSVEAIQANGFSNRADALAALDKQR